MQKIRNNRLLNNIVFNKVANFLFEIEGLVQKPPFQIEGLEQKPPFQIEGCFDPRKQKTNWHLVKLLSQSFKSS